MRTWIDNTGLHVIGRALEGNGECPSDIMGFLQFLTLLVFSDSLLLTGFESDSVEERTANIQSILLGIGVKKESILILPAEQAEYAKACTDAANIFSAHFRGALPVTESSNEAGLLKPAMPDIRGEELQFIPTIHSAITGGLTDSQRIEMKEHALTNKAAGAVGYMLSASDDLWYSVRAAKNAKEIDGHPWSDNDTELLGALLRVFLNNVLANGNGAEYAPAVARAELFRSKSHRLLSELSVMVGKPAGVSGTLGLPIPQVSYALLVRSGGNPHLMVEEALKLKEKGQELRVWLDSKLRDLVSAKSTEEEHRIMQNFRIEAGSLSEALEVDLKVRSRESTATTIDALELLFASRWLPSPKDTSKVVKWWKNRERVMLLTDASRALGRDFIEQDAFNNLKRSICKKASNKKIQLTSFVGG